MLAARAQNPAPAAGQGVLLAMTDLADGKRLIPGLFEEVRKGLNSPLRGKLEVLLEGVVAGLMVGSRTEPGQQGIAGGAAGRSGHIVMGKEPGRFREGIDLR